MDINKLIIFILFCSAICTSVAQIKNNVSPLIIIKQGIIKGLRELSENGKVFHSFYGIPYAEPPINNLRFKPPIPKAPWKGYYDATKIPEKCPTTSLYDQFKKQNTKSFKVLGKEDCLTLNVFTPEYKYRISKLPVMVYIHGGAYYFGSSFQYKPYALMGEDIVFVVIQYRLGILGFLSTEDEILPGNMGLKDQQLALKWVKGNIECFGGDPNLVTIFGESAGGSSVDYHLLSPASNGLFHRAIMQSGTALCNFAYPAKALKSAKAASDHFKCPLERGSARYLECMQSIDYRELVAFATKELKTWVFPLKFTPRADGDIIPDSPDVLLKNGKYSKVETMSGITKEEGAYIVIYMVNKPAILKNLNENFFEYGPKSLVVEDEKNPVGLASQIYQHYMGKTTNFSEEDYENFEKLFTDSRFKVCSYITEKFFAKDPEVDLYLYQMDHFGSDSFGINVTGYDRRDWVPHTDELHYLFGFSGPLTEERDIKVQQIFLKAWTNFAKYGNPNQNSLPCDCSWKKATKKKFRYFSIKEFPEMKKYIFPEVNNFWSTLETRQNEVFLKH